MNLLNTNILENMFNMKRLSWIWENVTIESLIGGLERFFFSIISQEKNQFEKKYSKLGISAEIQKKRKKKKKRRNL